MTASSSLRAIATGGGGAAPGLARSAKGVCLLDLDPELGSGISPEQWESARRATLLPVVRLARGGWPLRDHASKTDDVVGLIVVEGMMSRELALGAHHMLELLCRGDAVLLPTPAADGLRLGGDVVLTALTASRLVVLTGSFIHAAARWPALLTNLHRRLEAQRQRLGIQGLTAHLPRAEDRLLLTLWLLADSCGRVTPEGMVLPLALTHEVLAKLSAGRRPTITLALHRLESTGCIRRRHDGLLILTKDAQTRVEELSATDGDAPALGPSIVLHTLLQHSAFAVPRGGATEPAGAEALT